MQEVERKKYVPWEMGIISCREEDVIRTSTVDDGYGYGGWDDENAQSNGNQSAGQF